MCFRRYRDKEPTTAPVTTTPRATTPSEVKKATINVTVNPKSLSSNALPTSVPKPAIKVTKKIDMGAATNFGRDEMGINSPTHRNTHAEEDLFATSNTIETTTATSSNKADLLDDIFKTCSSTSNPVSEKMLPHGDDDFFNPREDESQEFGDFASAFGTSTQTTTTPVAVASVATPAPATVIAQPTQPIEQAIETDDTKKNEFADFGSAFTTTTNQTSSNSNDPANLLFAINTTPNAQQTTSNSNQKVGDLLSDLDGLTLDVSVPTGEFCPHNFDYFFFFLYQLLMILDVQNILLNA